MKFLILRFALASKQPCVVAFAVWLNNYLCYFFFLISCLPTNHLRRSKCVVSDESVATDTTRVSALALAPYLLVSNVCLFYLCLDFIHLLLCICSMPYSKFSNSPGERLNPGDGSLSRNRVYVLGYLCLVTYNVVLLLLFHAFSATLVNRHSIHKR